MIFSRHGRRVPLRLACLAAATALCSCALVGKFVAHTPPSPAIVAAPSPAIVTADPGVRRLADTDFGFRLLHQLAAGQPTGNVFFSPFSVSEALLLMLNGAAGQTRQDMAHTLGLGAITQGQVNAANALLLPSLANPDPKVEVSVANALWANQGVAFSPAFQERSRRFYNAQATTLDFGSPAAAQTINDWTSQNTHGKITRLVSQEDIADASVVLTNAVYFHGRWQTPFDKADTERKPFFLAASRTRSVPLMSQDGSYSYLETRQFQAVSLPYGAGRMSLYVFLPKKGTSLNTFVRMVNGSTADKWIGAMKPTEMTVLLPRFRANYEVTLNAPLSVMGMASAFGPGADFSPMGLKGAFISAVIHKAVLEVDEEGTVAAAVTGGEMVAAMPMTPVVVMRVDHPFFLAIRDNATGTILFEGVIRDPQP